MLDTLLILALLAFAASLPALLVSATIGALYGIDSAATRLHNRRLARKKCWRCSRCLGVFGPGANKYPPDCALAPCPMEQL